MTSIIARFPSATRFTFRRIVTEIQCRGFKCAAAFADVDTPHSSIRCALSLKAQNFAAFVFRLGSRLRPLQSSTQESAEERRNFAQPGTHVSVRPPARCAEVVINLARQTPARSLLLLGFGVRSGTTAKTAVRMAEDKSRGGRR